MPKPNRKAAAAVRRALARKENEGAIEQRCVDHARDRRWLARKMNGLGFRSWPDRLFIPRETKALLSQRRAIWVEFKRPGEGPTLEQRRMHKDLRARGEVVYIVDNLRDFIKIFERHDR